MLDLARLLTGTIAAAIVPLAMAWVGDAVPYRERQATLAKFLNGMVLGLLLGQTMGGFFADTIGWRWAFVFLFLALACTPVQRWTRWAWVVAVRRPLGLAAFGYCVLHFLAYFVVGQKMNVAFVIDDSLRQVSRIPGWLSLLLLTPLALTSTDGMARRLGGKRWKLLHRLAYVAVLCGMIHYYMLLKADKFNAYVYFGAFGGLMLFRLVRHYFDLHGEIAAAKEKLSAAKKSVKGANKKKFWTGELVVARIFDETHNVKTFRMVPLDRGQLPFEAHAGQYINLMLTIDGKRVNRSYTLVMARSFRPSTNSPFNMTRKS